MMVMISTSKKRGMPPLMTHVIVMMRLTVQPIPSRIVIQMIPTMTIICMPPNAYFPTYSCMFFSLRFIYLHILFLIHTNRFTISHCRGLNHGQRELREEGAAPHSEDSAGRIRRQRGVVAAGGREGERQRERAGGDGERERQRERRRKRPSASVASLAVGG